MAKGQNSQALQAFKSGSARILVASDALSRGLDVPGVDLVINYDAPAYPKTYVHRAGRTARAGKTGMSFHIPISPESSLWSSCIYHETYPPKEYTWTFQLSNYFWKVSSCQSVIQFANNASFKTSQLLWSISTKKAYSLLDKVRFLLTQERLCLHIRILSSCGCDSRYGTISSSHYAPIVCILHVGSKCKFVTPHPHKISSVFGYKFWSLKTKSVHCLDIQSMENQQSGTRWSTNSARSNTADFLRQTENMNSWMEFTFGT